jgi:hypothetical protein
VDSDDVADDESRTESNPVAGDLLVEIEELCTLYQASASRVGPLGAATRVPVWTRRRSGKYARGRKRWALGSLVRGFVESHIAISLDRIDKGVRLRYLGGPEESQALDLISELQRLRKAIRGWPRSIPLLNLLSLALAILPLLLAVSPDIARSALVLAAAGSVSVFWAIAVMGYRPKRAALGGGWGLTFRGTLDESRVQYDYWDFDESVSGSPSPPARDFPGISARESRVFGALPVRRPREFPLDLLWAGLVGFYIFLGLLVGVSGGVVSGSFSFGDGFWTFVLVVWAWILCVGSRNMVRAWKDWKHGRAPIPPA